MTERKKIGLIIVNPKSIYQQRVMNGVFSRCDMYGYDVAVFCPLVNAKHYYRNYLLGELNIFNLADLISWTVLSLLHLLMIQRETRSRPTALCSA